MHENRDVSDVIENAKKLKRKYKGALDAINKPSDKLDKIIKVKRAKLEEMEKEIRDLEFVNNYLNESVDPQRQGLYESINLWRDVCSFLMPCSDRTEPGHWVCVPIGYGYIMEPMIESASVRTELVNIKGKDRDFALAKKVIEFLSIKCRIVLVTIKVKMSTRFFSAAERNHPPKFTFDNWVVMDANRSPFHAGSCTIHGDMYGFLREITSKTPYLDKDIVSRDGDGDLAYKHVEMLPAWAVYITRSD